MGRIRDWMTVNFGTPNPADVPTPTFAVDAESVPAQIFGLETYSDPIAPASRISRREAIQCAAVKRARDLICGNLSMLPLAVYDTENIKHESNLLDQPERGRTRTATLADTIDDLLFEGVAYWRVTERGWDGYPAWIKRVRPERVSIDEDTGIVRVDGREIPSRDLIQFESPNDALLKAGARAIRTTLRLEAAAANYADGTPPIDYFTPAEGADPADDEDVLDLLNAWKDARRTRATAYVPASLNYNTGGWNPEQLQLADARQHAVLEIARAAGVDPESLGVSVGGMTYYNAQDRDRVFLRSTLGAYRAVIEQRLSMGDVTKRGYFVRFDLSDFLRADDKTRMEVHALARQLGIETEEEARAAEGKPALAPRPEPRALPTAAPEQEPA
jgi:HK97 family phage portal protein